MNIVNYMLFKLPPELKYPDTVGMADKRLSAKRPSTKILIYNLYRRIILYSILWFSYGQGWPLCQVNVIH